MKFIPQLKLMLHDSLSTYMNGDNIVPINIEISPCGICNANCSWCFYGAAQSNTILDAEVLMKFINEATALGTKAITWSGGGEPTLHPKFDYITKNIHIDQGLITNGLLMPKYNPSIFNWIRVSKTDAPWNEEVLAELKRTSKSLGMCINWMGEDEDEIKEALAIAHKLDIDYVQVRPALPTGGDTIDCPLPNIVDDKLLLTKYKFDEAKLSKDYDKCGGYNFVPFIWENGNYDVCAYQREDNEYNLGNIYNNTLAEMIEKYPAYVGVKSNCQTCCKNHEINKLIHTLEHIEDKNFV